MNNNLKQGSEELNLSDQALGAVMMALQKCILEEKDITEILRGLRFKNSEIGLMVINPPLFKISDPEDTITESA